MRKFSVLISPRNALNLAIAGFAAALMSGCSSDASRFGDPFSNPFGNSQTSVSQNTQPSYSGAPVSRVRTTSLSSSRSSKTDLASNEPRSSRSSSVGGGSKGWSTAGGTPIVVAQGESLHGLADRYGVPEKALLKANGFESAREVRPGTRLVIPVFRGRGDTQVASDEPRRRHHVADRDSDRDEARSSRHADRDGDEARDRKHKHRVADRDDERLDRKHSRRVADRDDDGDRRHRRDRADSRRDREDRVADSRSHKRDRDDRVADARSRKRDRDVAEDDRRSKKSRVAAEERRDSRRVADETPPARSKPQQMARAQTDPTPTASLGAGGGKPEFRWPARGRVIQGFRPGGNDGINIAVPEGTSVKAVEGGVVAYAGSELKGYGNMVLIRHPNGYVSAYANNGSLDVKRGDTVRRGQIIAKSGRSGNVSSPQLHFELRKGTTPVDPNGLLAGT